MKVKTPAKKLVAKEIILLFNNIGLGVWMIFFGRYLFLFPCHDKTVFCSDFFRTFLNHLGTYFLYFGYPLSIFIRLVTWSAKKLLRLEDN